MLEAKLVSEQFYMQIKVFGEKASERMPTKKMQGHAIESKKWFVPNKEKIYLLSKEKKLHELQQCWNVRICKRIGFLIVSNYLATIIPRLNQHCFANWNVLQSIYDSYHLQETLFCSLKFLLKISAVCYKSKVLKWTNKKNLVLG